LTTRDLAALDTDQAAALTSDQISALSATQIAAISADGIAVFETGEISALSTAQISALKTAQIAGLSTDQISALTGRPAFLKECKRLFAAPLIKDKDCPVLMEPLKSGNTSIMPCKHAISQNHFLPCVSKHTGRRSDESVSCGDDAASQEAPQQLRRESEFFPESG
jgi:hypothetical protein